MHFAVYGTHRNCASQEHIPSVIVTHSNDLLMSPDAPVWLLRWTQLTIMRYWWVSFSIMASEVSCWAGLSLIWVIGNNMSQSKTSTFLYVKHYIRCSARLSVRPSTFYFVHQRMHRSSDQLRFVDFADDTTVLHPTVTLTVFMHQWTGNWQELITGSGPTDFLWTLVKLHIW